MVVDSSALVAILLGEATAEELIKAFSGSGAIIAAPNVLEVCMVMRKYVGDEAKNLVSAQLNAFDVSIVPFGKEHLEAANMAFAKFGKGSHKAGLNFGDCIAYALAKSTAKPLLFTGNDFLQTDIIPVLQA